VNREDFYFPDKNVYLHNDEYLVANNNFKILGVLKITYDISYLWALISPFDVENIHIVNRDGNVLLSKKNTESSKKIIDKNIFEKYTSNYNNLITYKDESGNIVSGVSTQVKSLDWTLITESILYNKISYARRISNLALMLGIIILLITLFEIFIFRKKIIKPLGVAVENANKVASGDYSHINTEGNNWQIDSIIESVNNLALSTSLFKNDFDNQLKIKTNQLRKSVKEAESMSSLMVNRELKMIELKRENDDLKNKIKSLSENNYNSEGEE
jgi:methyl-accepting chemotaxis protein